MKILVYGAGNIGCLYAALLAESGQSVSVLARGQRLADLCAQGILLGEWRSAKRISVRVPAIQALGPDDAYDLILVVLPRHRVAEALPALAANRRTPSVLFFGNNAAGPSELVEALGGERVLLGFPGAAAHPDKDRIRYLICSPREQPTTIGELDDRKSERIRAIAATLETAGFPVAICPAMDAWLKTHAVEIAPTVMALFMCGGDRLRMARTRDSLVLMLRAIREGHRVLRKLGVLITPANHRVFGWLPEPILLALMRRMVASEETAVKIGHAEAGRPEWQAIAEQLRALAAEARIPTPALDRLSRHLDPQAEPLPDGASMLRPTWRRQHIHAGPGPPAG